MENNILKNIWLKDDRIPSIRQIAIEMSVNPNTIKRVYDNMQAKGIIYNKRGIGFFVEEHAKEKIVKNNKDYFMKSKMPNLFSEMKLLDISIDDIIDLYDKFKMN